MRRERKEKRNKGFTLVEMVIVVAILAILVGVLAPQYTKYVEKSRKAADAENMEELVRAVSVCAVDGMYTFDSKGYEITIGAGGKGAATSAGTSINPLDSKKNDEVIAEITKEFPNWESLTTKSKKWGNKGRSSSITATINVQPDGGLTVTYKPDSFAKYMASGDTK